MATQTNNYGLTKPAWDEMVDVSVLNDNSDIIDAQMHANETMAAQSVANMADAYDATATYQTGDYCTYGGKLYQANTDISTAEAFDNTHWDETTAAEHFSDGGGGGGGTLIQPVIYSDTEREVGVWRDGKPLYQITFSGYVNIVSTSRTWTVIRTSQELSSLNIDTAFIADGTYLVDSNDNTIYLSPTITGRDAGIGIIFGVAITDTGALAIVTDNMTSGSNYCSVTIQYTKTTDTAGSGTWTPSGVPAVHYSTDEQIIGTWVDGSTIYQRAFTGLSTPTRGTGWAEITDIDASTWENIIDATVYRVSGAGTLVKMPLAEIGISNNNHPQISVVSSDFNGTVSIAIFTYIKSTS